MTDRRLLRSNGRVAHVSLRGQVEAERFVEGERMMCKVGGASISATPDGRNERQMLMGEAFMVLEKPDDTYFGWAFGFAAKDGYAGYVPFDDLTDWREPTHRVSVRATLGLESPDIKDNVIATTLCFGDRIVVDETHEGWCRHTASREIWVPERHLSPVATYETSMVEVARLFLGVPYRWGGNSARGIDCSGLVQAVRHACGLACPGDSDMQEAMPGEQLSEGAALEPGDLIFWKGHVAMATGPKTMIHANGHHMMVVEEPIAPAIVRIAAKDAGPVTSRLRPDPVLFQPVV